MIERLFDSDVFRKAGHQLVDTLSDYLQQAARGEMPVLPSLPPLATASQFTGRLPKKAVDDPVATMAELTAEILAGSNHLHHPGYIGHQVAPPLPLTALADLVGSVLNQGMGVYDMGPLATQIERQTVRWLCEAIGWMQGADGVFTSGGSLGNLTALLVARNRAASGRSWQKGVANERSLVLLTSEQAHYSVARAAGILGLGTDAVVKVACDRRFRMDVAALEAAYMDTLRTGKQVMAVVGSACSTATGSYDPLGAIGAFCREYGLWFHVDGAHGASALLSQDYAHYCDGIQLADSVVWDAHKLLYVPGISTAVLFREGRLAFDAFDQNASYLFGRDAAEADFDIALRTVECTKRMLAWKLWIALRLYGADMMGELVSQVFDLTRSLDRLLRQQTDFEVLTQPMANILCFRYRPEGKGTPVGDLATLNALQSRLRERVVADGDFYLVQTMIGEACYLRVTVMNPLTPETAWPRLISQLRFAAESPNQAWVEDLSEP